MLVNPHDGCVYTLPFVPHLGHFHRVLVICVSYQCIKDPFPYPAFRPATMTDMDDAKVTEAFG